LRLLIREARPEDRGFIEEIGRLTWGGRDYLPRVFDEWLGDNFYVLEVEGVVVGTAKLTLMPGGVGWLEGLRVHPDYRGRGYGRLLHGFMVSLGERLAREGLIVALEYATHSRNRASVRLAEETGFRVRARFYHLSAPPEALGARKPERTRITWEDLDPLLDPIPVGWHFLERIPDSLEWISRHAEAYRIDHAKFLAEKGSATFTPLTLEPKKLESLLPAMAWIARERGSERISVIIPEKAREALQTLEALGFKAWRTSGEPNVVVFRKDLAPKLETRRMAESPSGLITGS